MTDASLISDLELAVEDAAEIVLDGLDRAPVRVVGAVAERLLDENDPRRYVIFGTSRQRLGLPELLLSGRGIAIDPALFSLNAEEIARLADAAKAAYEPDDIAALLEATEGWRLAVTGIVRHAAESGLTLGEAIDPWCRERGSLVLEHLECQVPVGEEIHAMLDAGLSADAQSARRYFERLESLGFPIQRPPEGLRPYRIIEQIVRLAGIDQHPADEPPLMLLNLLGRFHCQIGGREVRFQRRREMNVFAYVALAKNGQRSREELIAAFWHDVPHSVASQNLRTALSRIRHAIAAIVGNDAVDRYFNTAAEIKLSTTLVVLDVRRFSNHISQGMLDEGSRSKTSVARYHYSAAERLYGDGLLASEAAEPCFAAPAAELERSYREVLAKLVRLTHAEGEIDRGRDYMLRLMNRTDDVELRESIVRSTFETAVAT